MATLREPIPSAEISRLAAAFDITRVRCAAEAALWAAIEKNTEFKERLLNQSGDREAAAIRGKISLITDAYRVDPAITPHIGHLCDCLRDALGVVQPIDMYVKASPECNASCLPSRKGTRLVMCLHSELLRLLTPRELLFIMGHEAGHALLGHTRVPHIDFDDQDFSPLEVVRIRALDRRQEISCDRIGLLVCQDVQVAGSALFKLMCGLPEDWLQFDARTYAAHFDKIAETAEMAPLDDAVSTHPIIALRVKALLSFANSSMYAEALGKKPGEDVNDNFEKAVEHMLSTLEPDLSELESASEQDALNSFLIRGALVIAMADETLDADEVRYLKSKIKLSDEMTEAMAKPGFMDASMQALANDASVLSRKLNMHGRAGVLRELCYVALAVGGYASAEMQPLIAVAQMLDIPAGLFHQIVESSQPPALESTSAARPARKKKSRKKAVSPSPEASELQPAVAVTAPVS